VSECRLTMIDYLCPNEEDLLKEIPGACGSRLTSSLDPTFYTVMQNLFNQTAIRTEKYEFETCFTQEIQIAYPIQVRTTAAWTQTVTVYNGTHARAANSVVLPMVAVIGFAVGGVLCFLAIVLGVWFCMKRKSARKMQRLLDSLEPKALYSRDYAANGQLHSSDHAFDSPITSELDGRNNGPLELQGHFPHTELDSRSRRAF
jgi:hypothetical protein